MPKTTVFRTDYISSTEDLVNFFTSVSANDYDLLIDNLKPLLGSSFKEPQDAADQKQKIVLSLFSPSMMVTEPGFKFIYKAVKEQTLTPSLCKVYVKAYTDNMSLTDAAQFLTQQEMADSTITSNEQKIENFKNAVLDMNSYDKLFLISGETGTGKTTLCKELFPDAFFVACISGMLPSDLMLEPDPDKALCVRPTEFAKRLGITDKPSVIILDEINQADATLYPFLQQITDGVKNEIFFAGQTIKISPTLRIIGTMNPDSEVDNRNQLGKALLSRAYGIVLNLTDEEIAERVGCPLEFVKNIREIYQRALDAGIESVRELDLRLIRRYWLNDLRTGLEFNLTGQRTEDHVIYTDILLANNDFNALITACEQMKAPSKNSSITDYTKLF